MEFIGWMYDVAREQSPPEALLAEMLNRSGDAGYNAVGLYLEHGFAYATAPRAAGAGCLTPDVVRRQQRKRACTSRPRMVPFINTLGHMEGFIRTEGGQWLAEGVAVSGSEQMCATREECVGFARGLVEDVIDAFDDEWIHLGGDETGQLGQCPRCAARVAEVGPAGLYGEYYGPLCRFVLERGRRPCLWGDMLLEHPAALDALPPETVIFDWQYFTRPRASTELFRRRGFDVVCCPSIQTYNSGWCFLDQSRRNIDEHADDARAAGALGVLVTTWEQSYFSQYASILPLVYAAGRRLSRREDWDAALNVEGGSAYAEAADLLGNRLPAAAQFLRPGTWRQLREHFVIRQNPFYLWECWRDEACGPAGDEVLRICDAAHTLLESDTCLRFASDLHRVAVEWVRLVERAARAYADGDLDLALSELVAGPGLLERLRPGLERAAADGGSTADLRRLDILTGKVERAVARIGELGRCPGGRPAFSTITHDAYVPGDQAAWSTVQRR